MADETMPRPSTAEGASIDCGRAMPLEALQQQLSSISNDSGLVQGSWSMLLNHARTDRVHRACTHRLESPCLHLILPLGRFHPGLSHFLPTGRKVGLGAAWQAGVLCLLSLPLPLGCLLRHRGQFFARQWSC